MPASSASPVIVGLVEITEPTNNLSYLPYSVGLLQAYAMAHAADPSRYAFLLPQFLRMSIPLAAEQLAAAQIAGFSTYVWNVNYNLALAQALKVKNPDTLTVFGGPQVPDEPAAFLAQHPFVDVCVHGEGEATFLRLLEAWPGNQWESIPGISYRGAEGTCITNPRAERIKDLDLIPSPYAGGVLDALIAAHPELKWAVVWETNRGCPFSCSFCDWGSAIASKVFRFGDDRLDAEMRWFGQKEVYFIYLADANYGILPRDVDIARRLVAVRQAMGFPKRIITQMTKNQPERAFEAHQILSEGGMLLATALSLQSLTPGVLEAVKRENISLPAYHQLLQRFVQSGIQAYTDLILGLPGESFDTFLDGIDALLSQGQHHELRIGNLQLLPNAELAAPASRQKFGIESVLVPFQSSFDRAALIETGIQEACEMVVATHTMPYQDWLRMQALAWMVQMLYYSRLMQLPLLLIHELTGLSHREMLLAFFEAPLPSDTPVQGFFRQFLLNKAREFSQGQSEYCETKDPATGQTVWISSPDFILLELIASGQIGPYYQECGRILNALLSRRGLELPPKLLEEALRLSRFVFEGGLKYKRNHGLELSYNLLECYLQILNRQPIELRKLRAESKK
ncbi:MAG: radical SAM protein [Candidatus Sericytochromatia bacterium]